MPWYTELASVEAYAPNALAIANAIAATAILGLGTGVLARGRRRPSHLLFFILTTCCAGWLGAFALMYASRHFSVATSWARAGQASVFLLAAALLHFSSALAPRRTRLSAFVPLVWIISAAAAGAALTTPLFLAGLYRYSWGYYPAATRWSIWGVLFLAAVVIASFQLIWQSYRRAEGVAKERARALVTAFAVASLAMFDHLPQSGVEVSPIGHFAALAFTVIVTTALWKFDLSEITPAYAAGQILETMKSAVVVSDMDGRIRVVNRAVSRLLGMPADRLLGEHLRQILPPSESHSTGQLLNSLGVLEHPMQWKAASGQGIDVLVASSFLRDEENRPRGVVYVASDFTERKRAETALRASEQRYRTLFELNPLPMWVYDFETLRFTDVNAACIRHYGYTREEFLAMTIADIRPEDELSAMNDALRTIKARSGPGGFRHRKKDGSIIDVEVTSFEFDSSGRRSRLVIAQDVTQRKRAEEDLRRSEERYRELFENAHDVVYTHDLDGVVTSMNVTGERVSGYGRGELIGRRIQEVIAPEHLDRVEDALAKMLEADVAAAAYEVDLVTRDGRCIPLELSTRLIREDGKPAGVQGIGRDLTERKASETRYRLLFERNLAGVYRTGTDGRIIECNDSCARIFGYDSREEFLAADARGVYYDPAERQHLIDQLRQQRQLSNVEQRLRRRDGSEVWVLENITLLDGEVLEGAIIDITDRKRAEGQLAHQAYHDGLTGLPNRLLFRDRIEVALARARRNRLKVAVMFLDLDQFKLVNDTLGHTVGDRLLQAIASRLVSSVRAADTVARMGGDEFTILLSDLTVREGADAAARKVLEAVRHPVVVDEHELNVSTSIGIAIYPEDGEDAESLLKKADGAMYRAKELGRDNFVFATPAVARITGGVDSAERELRAALESGDLVLDYQPIFDVRTGGMVAAEARLRWSHPEHGLLHASDFLGLAEETQLLDPLGEWVLRDASRQMKAWHDAGFDWLRLAVGLPLRQLSRDDCVSTVDDILEASGLPPSAVEFCVSEGIAARNPDFTVPLLARLRQTGVRLAVEGFGSGACTPAQLSRLPVQMVKIDAFMLAEPGSSDSAAVAAIVSMCRTLGLGIAATGVQTAALAAAVRALPFAEMQGRALAPTLPVARFEHLLHSVAAARDRGLPADAARLSAE